MLLCGIWALSNWRHMSGVTLSVVGGARKARRRRNRGRVGRAPMMERFEERWRRRQEGGR
jgi:hypothetical protein